MSNTSMKKIIVGIIASLFFAFGGAIFFLTPALAQEDGIEQQVTSSHQETALEQETDSQSEEQSSLVDDESSHEGKVGEYLSDKNNQEENTCEPEEEKQVQVCEYGKTHTVPASAVANLLLSGATLGKCSHNEHQNRDLGTIRICKMIVDENGLVVATKSTLPAGSFSIALKKGSSPNDASDIGVALFSQSTFQPNTDLIGNDGKNDAECRTFNELEVSAYYYAQEVISDDSSNIWATPKYNDQNTTNVASTSDFYSYSNELFTTDSTDDQNRNQNADGHIVLTSDRLNRTLVVLNSFKKDVPVPSPTDITISATKIICPNETDLPNWSQSSQDITAGTVSTFLTAHPSCAVAPDWKFQWGYSSVTDPGDAFIGEATNGWTTFAPTTQVGVATTSVAVSTSTEKVWVREVLKDGYIPFTFHASTTVDPVSAEMYCHTDVLNYDNYDYIKSPKEGEKYYCVAFNVLKVGHSTNTPPRIMLVGSNPVNIIVGNTFVDLGAVATDTEDGDLTSHIVATGTVNTNATGTYTVIYSVTDSGGLSATTSRTIIIVSSPVCTSNCGGWGTPTQCSDGIDNDHDGKIDFPTDLGCANGEDNDENNPPTIILNGSSTISLIVGSPYIELGATASDTEDGILTPVATGTVSTTTIGTYIVRYTATDSKGLSVFVERTINVVSTITACSDGVDNDNDGTIDFPRDTGCDSPQDNDENAKPIITVTLPNPTTVTLGGVFTDLGATATDTEDGNITANIIATGTVNVNILGTYFIAYNVVDSKGFHADTATRTVNVVNPVTPPTGGGGGGGTPPQCADGSDNDNDGKADYPKDPGCTSSIDNDETDTPVVPPSTGGGGGGGTGLGGGSGIPTLQIFNEHLASSTGTAVTVTWNTNLPATSRVVYDITSHTNIGSAPNYGYAKTTGENTTLTTNHAVEISGLPNGVINFFRPISKDGVSTVYGIELSTGVVAGASSCSYLEEYLRYGYKNNAFEVTKLQMFLRDLEGFTDLKVTGTFDIETDKAVRTFQDRYKNDVLAPWKLPGNTGYVYFTTKKKVNEIYCQKAFPLDDAQKKEISEFAMFMDSIKEGILGIPRAQASEGSTGMGGTYQNTLTFDGLPNGDSEVVPPTDSEETTTGGGILKRMGLKASELLATMPFSKDKVSKKINDTAGNVKESSKQIAENIEKDVASGTAMLASTSKDGKNLLAGVGTTMFEKFNFSNGNFWAGLIIFLLVVAFVVLGMRKDGTVAEEDETDFK